MNKYIEPGTQNFIEEYLSFLEAKDFPCIAAKAAHEKHLITCMVADNMACPKDDAAILLFLYDFVDAYRSSNEIYNSAAIIFLLNTRLKGKRRVQLCCPCCQAKI